MVANGTVDRILDRPMTGTPNVPPSAGLRPSDHGGFVSVSNVDPRVQEYRRAGMSTIERYTVRNVLNAKAADRLDSVLRQGDGQGLTARYLAAETTLPASC